MGGGSVLVFLYHNITTVGSLIYTILLNIRETAENKDNLTECDKEM